MFAGSKDNVKWLLARLTPRTIGPDKINQLRHVRFLKNEAGILQLMDRHRALIAPKFQKVLDIFGEKLAQVPERQLDPAQGRLLHQPRRSQGLRPAGGRARQRSRRRAHACRSDASIRERSRRPHHSHCSHVSRIDRSRSGCGGRGVVCSARRRLKRPAWRRPQLTNDFWVPHISLVVRTDVAETEFELRSGA